MPAAALLLRTVLAAAAAGTGAASLAAESAALASSVYRLSVERPEAFRLAATGVSGAAPAGNRSISSQLADMPFAALINKAAREAAVDPALVHAVIHVESRYDAAAQSPKGALGLMQVLPETAARFGVAHPARSVEGNLRAGTRYLRSLMDLFDNRLELVLAAYNAGERAVLRHGQRIPPYRETRHYVPAVLSRYRELQAQTPSAAPRQQRIAYLPGTLLESAAQPALMR